jgi:hypothetical protein
LIANDSGEVDEIDPVGQLVTSCGDVIRVAAGDVLTTVADVGGDEIWFNPGEERVYFGGFRSINVPILNTDNNRLVTTLVVGQSIPCRHHRVRRPTWSQRTARTT